MLQPALVPFPSSPSSPSFHHDHDLSPGWMVYHGSRSHYRVFGIDRGRHLCTCPQLDHHHHRDGRAHDRLYPCIHALTSVHHGICHHHRVSFPSIEILHDSFVASPGLLPVLSSVTCSACALPCAEIVTEIVILSSSAIPEGDRRSGGEDRSVVVGK